MRQGKNLVGGRVLGAFTVALVISLSAGCGGSGSTGGTNQSPAGSSLSSAPLRDDVVVPARIAWGDHPSQFADLYLPDESSGLLPVIIMIHGGCWSSAYGLEFQAGLAQAMAGRGFAVWNIEYRRLGNGGEWPVMFKDVAAAADYLPAIAQDYQLNTRAVTVIGHSAGGHLALWLASRGQIAPDSRLYNPEPLAVKGVLSLAGIGDLTSRACGESAGRILDRAAIDTAQYQARLAAASPLELLPTGVSTRLLSGSNDGIVPSDLAQAYVGAAQLAGDDSEHLLIAGADHFDLIDPEFMDITLLENTLRQMLAQ
ncbi:alpha/beta hydrolase family protein [Gilvimarinus agarilyticus]|uniref:alpha/beta hydrolase family protein n=1 Tax=Gilvimarinus agarilyticus TaxID=679259 RepID=UPI0009FDBDCD|nr:alpha/beta hydrolase [Gilvimarinus agarilyticus]